MYTFTICVLHRPGQFFHRILLRVLVSKEDIRDLGRIIVRVVLLFVNARTVPVGASVARTVFLEGQGILRMGT